MNIVTGEFCAIKFIFLQYYFELTRIQPAEYAVIWYIRTASSGPLLFLTVQPEERNVVGQLFNRPHRGGEDDMLANQVYCH